MDVEELKNRLEEINNRCQELAAKATAEKRDLTSDEDAEMAALLDEFDRNKARVAQLERFQSQSEDLRAGQGRKTQADAPTRVPAQEDDGGDDDAKPAKPPGRQALAPKSKITPGVYAEPIKERKGGFKSLGEMALSVAKSCTNGGITDPRLERLASATTYANEAAGSDGGFAVPPDFRAEVMAKVLGEDSLLSRCDQITTPSNNFTMVVDESTLWGTSGIQAYWDGEAATATQSKPVLESRQIKLNKIRALVPATEELLEDAPAMDAYLRKKAPEVINFKVSQAIFSGSGTAQPLGILNSPALVTVAKTASQTAATLTGDNVIKMWSRMYGPCRSNAVWLINQDIEPYLLTMSIAGRDAVGNSVTGWGIPVFVPAGGYGGLSASPFATLMGRPIIPTQVCNTLGSLGDIVLCDLTKYLALLKSGINPRVEVSMHLWFDQDLLAFKFVLRVGGFPWWGSAISPRSGSNTMSCFVALEAR